MATLAPSQLRADLEAPGKPDKRRRYTHKLYPHWFLLPGAAIYAALFIIPSFASFYFAFTRWTFFDVEFIGFENFITFFNDPQLSKAFVNTLIYGALTSVLKVVLGLGLGMLFTSDILARGYLRAVVFFPVLVSTVGVGITFQALLDPFDGVVNNVLAIFGIDGPGWLTNPSLVLYSIIGIDVWKGVGLAALIYMAGLVSIPREYYEAAKVDGASAWANFRYITLPLVRPATTTVVILSLIGGLRSFEIIWATTGGGPGFSSDVLASVIFKQYAAGFYGLSTAGNVVLFVTVAAIIVPLFWWLNRKQTDL
jgi:raffinose/stachyose/melibiose transport system permease protein